MNWTGLLFAVFSVLAVASAIMVVALRDPIKSALALIASFFCTACLFLLQKAELVAVLEVLVYAGAIMVLFIFVLMLVENKDLPLFTHKFAERVGVPIKIGAVLAAVTGVLVVGLIPVWGLLANDAVDRLDPGFGGVAAVGREFFRNYLFHFELTSILLLVGIVGAVSVTRRGKE